MLIKSGGGTGPMKPGNLSASDALALYLAVIRCQFPRDEIDVIQPSALGNVSSTCAAEALLCK